jgi:DNA-binding GntR family transcriptional regulator
VASMRGAILTGALPPGMKLRQHKLAEQFGTTRIPVRDALQALAYEGLVSSMPYRGYVVTELDGDDIQEVYDLRIILESHAVRLAVPLITDEDLQTLASLHAAIAEAPSTDEHLAALEEFYIKVYALSGRPRLVGLISRLRQQVARTMRWPTLQHAIDHHERFFVAIRTGDAEAAATELATHYRHVATLIRRHLRETAVTGHRKTRVPAVRASTRAAESKT